MKYFRLSGWSWSLSSKNIPSFIIHERVSLFIVFIQTAFSPLLAPVSYALVIDYTGQDISTITRVVWPWLTNNRDVFFVPNSWRRSFDLGGYFSYFLFSYFPVFSCILVSDSFTSFFFFDRLSIFLSLFFWYSLSLLLSYYVYVSFSLTLSLPLTLTLSLSLPLTLFSSSCRLSLHSLSTSLLFTFQQHTFTWQQLIRTQEQVEPNDTLKVKGNRTLFYSF